jgi:alkyl hydroperoxide reductase subunit AhpF
MTTIIQVLVPVLATAVGTMLIAFANSASTYMKKKTESNLLNDYIAILCDTVVDVVQGLNQTTVQQIKDAAEDGKLTSDEIATINAQAIETVKSIVGVKGISILQLAFEDIDTLIANKIERAVVDCKNMAC